MDQSAFYGVVAAVEFTLLGLWWVAVKDRTDLATPGFARMAYLMSLQFMVPATVSLLAQVAPDQRAVWRISFVVAGVVGAVAFALLGAELRRSTTLGSIGLGLGVVGAALYVVVVLVALAPDAVADLDLGLKPIQVEAILLSLLVFVGVQAAWLVHMTPARDRAVD